MTLVKRDIATRFVVSKQVGPVSIATDTNTDGVAFDLGQYPGWKVLMVASVGTRTDGSFTAKLQESDDGSTGWTDVSAFDGSAAAVSAADTTREAAYAPAKRYVRVRVVSASTTSGALVSAHLVIAPPGV